ncbi:B3 DNA binding domain-containing protein [Dioscorea alata]|uniref:B3 DNA binding domain-containing protein n=1 Tax=Dioscorea alata TaxID=55571 RepID=A0ACB7UK68_DIOAL|nr:B3 DNA binding domain-containing protein [Dioscorea alata]
MAKPPKKKKNTVSFFKVMVGDFKSSMRIPPCFAKHLKGRVRSLLRSSNGGGAWRVRVDKLDGSLFFRGGWESFAEAHSITDGDFVVFVFDGDRGFDVTVYGKNGCEKELPAPVKSEEVVGCSIPDPREVDPALVHVRSSKTVVKEGIIEAVGDFKTVHPHFLGVCRKTRLNHMTVPKPVVRECGLFEKRSVILRDSLGCSWSVQVKSRKDGRVDFATGWSTFRQEKGLVYGDVCLFEFAQAGKVINVHIFRTKKEIAEPKSENHIEPQKRPLADNGGQSAFRAAKSFKSKHSHFIVSWKRAYKYKVRIPMVHVKIHRLDKKHKMIVYDPHGKSWPVELHARPKRGIDLSSGWHNICNANNLQEGDACIFEFIHADAIRLHIFRSGKVKEQQNSDSKPCITVPLP